MQEGPPEFDQIFAGILLAATDVMRTIERAGKLRPFHKEGDKFVAGSIEEYCAWAHSVVTGEADITKACIEHLMAWIADDLHVRRLRRIWQEMGDSLGKRAERLDNPKEPDCRGCCSESSNEEDLQKS